MADFGKYFSLLGYLNYAYIIETQMRYRDALLIMVKSLICQNCKPFNLYFQYRTVNMTNNVVHTEPFGRARVDDLSIFDRSSSFFLLIKFYCIFPIFYKILPYYVC